MDRMDRMGKTIPQFIRQPPGPRGSPQDPQPPDGTDAADERLDVPETANTDSCLSSARPWHCGHDGWRSLDTSVSNWW